MLKNYLKSLLLLLCMIVGAGTAWGETKSVDITPSQALNDGGVSPITIVCAKGDGTSNPAISSGQLRLYQAASGKTTGNTITFSSEKTITSIVFTFANNMTADNGSFSEGSYNSETSTWSGSTNSVTLTCTGTKSGERIYITAIKVYYEGGESSGGDSPTHTATFSVNGNTTTQDFEEGANIEFPDQPADINGFKFVGWSSSVISGTIVEAPEFVTSATMGDADITYYAVFAEETEGEAVERLTQTLQYDTWTYSGTTTNKSSYRLFGNGAYVESAAFDLSKLSKVKIYGGTFGGSNYKTVTIGDGTNIWKDVEMTGTGNAKEHSFADGTALSGTKALRVISTCGDGKNNGIRISKIEIFTNEPSIAYTNYCTTVSALPKPVITLSTQSIEMTWGDTDKVLTVSAKINNADFDGIITLASSSNNLTIDGSGNIRCDVPGNYVITASIAAKEGEYQAATPVVCNVIVNKKTVTLSFPEAEYTADVNDGFTAPELTNTSSVVVEYSSTDETVATVAADGTVTLKKDGVTTIKATFAGNNFYEAAEASYTLNVNNRLKPGTQINPYTIAQAIDAIDNDGDVNGVYVKGVISQIDSYNSNYKSITYWISEDGTTENQFEVYSGKGLNGADFSSKEDLQLGDVVVVYGNITYYSKNNVYEFSANNQLFSLERKGDAGLSYETTAYYVTVGGTFAAPALTNPHDLTVTYSSSDTEVATVNAETGEVTLGSKVGTTTITASFAGNGEYNAASASYTLTVEYPATTTTLNKTAVELDLADDVPTATLVATVKQGEDVIENATITWTSDDEEVATVDNNGIVTAVAKGTATITATFSADGYKTSTATCEVTVINSASGVIDLAKTGTISFSDFSNAGNSYNNGDAKTTELIASNKIGYEWSGNSYMYNNQSWQFQKSNGTATSPVIKSKKGFTVTFNYDNTKPSISVNDEDVEEDMSDSESVTYTVNSTSTAFVINKPSGTMYITSITITPIKDNRTLAFSEPTTEILVNGTATNTATATPAGTITYTSSDETVATVDTEGKVTGVKIGTATITATVAEDADYNEATASYEVTVNGIPAATDIVLTATDANDAPVVLSEMKVGTIGTFAATYTKAAASVTVTYTSDATDVLTINNGAFEAAKGGTANVTVTITPDDADHYVAVSKEFEVTVLNAQKGTTVLALFDGEFEETAAGSTLYGTNISLTAKLANQYDGTVTASLTNDAIANVAVEGENITITPKAVGTTIITFTAPETANFEGEVSKTYALTVTAPEGRTACEVTPAEVVLNETFSKCDSHGGNDGDFAPSSNTAISSSSSVTDVEGWTLTKAYEASGCVKLGSSNNVGSATTPSLSVSAGKTYTLTFNAAPWSAESATMTVSVSGGTINGEGTVTTATMTTGEWNSFEYNILATAAEMKIEFTCSQKRFFLDEVKVEIPEVAPAIPDVTIAESGYASFCCEYPLDFTEANENYKAWYVSEVSGTTVTFKQIKGKIAGGVPFFLYGEPGTYHLQVAAESTETLSGNMLVGTLAPTYVESVVGDYTNFGLSAGSFKKMNTGVVKANKAYLPVLTEGISAGARLNIIFDEEDTPTGISSVNNENLNQRKDVYNLNGQRVENMKKGGLYIVNGKKVFMKGQR